jgi:hypothetical protein
MHINDCEVFSREVRGQRLAIIAGPRPITPAEGAALLEQFYARATGPEPIYSSPGGWQILEPVPALEPDAKPKAAAKTKGK